MFFWHMTLFPVTPVAANWFATVCVVSATARFYWWVQTLFQFDPRVQTHVVQPVLHFEESSDCHLKRHINYVACHNNGYNQVS